MSRKVTALVAILSILCGGGIFNNSARASDERSRHRIELKTPKNLIAIPSPTSVIVTFDASAFASSYKVRLSRTREEDEGRSGIIVSPFNSGESITNLIPGTKYWVSVQAIAKESNYLNSEKSRSISFTTTLPLLSFDAPPINQVITSNPTPRLRFSSLPGAAFKCSIDSGAYTTCTSPFTPPALSEGTHIVSAYAIVSGVAGPAASFSFTIDTIAPVISNLLISDGPSYSATWNESASPGTNVSFTCHLDSASPVACVSPFTIGSVSVGSHTFTVTGQDLAGNQGQGFVSLLVQPLGPTTLNRVVMTIAGAPTISLFFLNDADFANYAALATNLQIGSSVTYISGVPGFPSANSATFPANTSIVSLFRLRLPIAVHT